jgi:two-component system sensor histidine kinase BaeS
VELITQGAHAVASRKFDARIDVRTGDELGQLAEDFNMMAQTLERYENLRKQWISDISHELRTPVSILRGEIEAIQDGLREVTDKNIGSLHAEVMHLQKLINDLHSLAVADNGSLSMKKEKIDIIGLLENSAEKFRPQYSRAGITLEFDKIPGENIFVTTDRDRLSQVFSNIFENTLRYTDSPGEMKIRHEVRHGKIHLYFEDSKPGVPEESFAKLFDRLYRVDTSRSRKRGGSGLGLAICKSIIESSGGEINASGSRLGGLMIEIVMPVLKGE